ncbi:MAG: type IV fimbrial biogenesis protein FimT [Alloalcanivorax venustensis]
MECAVVADARFKNRGFTLIELMLGILVAGVLLALAVPSFQNLMANNALRTASADLVTAINTARSQAVSLRKDVILKQKNSDWSDGWEVEYDASVDVEGQQHFTPTGQVSVTAKLSELTFRPSGMVSDEAEFTICDDRSGENGRRIRVKKFGVIENETIVCG